MSVLGIIELVKQRKRYYLVDAGYFIYRPDGMPWHIEVGGCSESLLLPMHTKRARVETLDRMDILNPKFNIFQNGNEGVRIF